MRKLSELLKICTYYHYSFGGVARFMCNAAKAAHRANELTITERDYVINYIQSHIVDLGGTKNGILYELIRYKCSLGEYGYLPYTKKDLMFLVYSTIIDKLESQNN